MSLLRIGTIAASTNVLGIYIHIPFCVRKCPYCDFTSFTGEIPENEYVAALIEEMSARRSETDGEVETIYFGGGTPSLLSPKAVEQILSAISQNFRIIPPSLLCQRGARGDFEPEITIEANPGTVTLEKLKGYKDVGVNRLSIGFQSLNDRLLSILGRIHTRKVALEAYDAARRAGFANVGVDLIHSVPGESLEDWLRDLNEAVFLRPEHISAYSLTVEEETHFSHLQEKGLLVLPAEEEQVKMFLATKEILGAAGYEHYEVSNYALQGLRSRHNQIYWNGGEYLGIGVSAHSYISGRLLNSVWGVRKGNTQNLAEYFHLINEKGTAFTEEEILTKEKAMGEAVFLGLRMLEGVDLMEFEERFGIAIEQAYPDAVDELLQKGLLEITEGHLRLTKEGLLLLNEVSVRFV